MTVDWAMLDAAEQVWSELQSQIGDAELAAPSGCADWTVRELINHVIGGAERYAMLLDGATAEDTATTRGRDYVADGAADTFRVFEARFRDAVARADLDVPVDHRVARRPGRELFGMRVMELALHAHDLAVATDADWRPGDELGTYLLREASPLIEEFRAVGAVGAPTRPHSDSPADRFLAFAGRG